MAKNHEQKGRSAAGKIEKGKPKKLSRRALFLGAASVAGVGVYTNSRDIAERYETAQIEAEKKRLEENPDNLSWQELREQDNEKIRIDAEEMLHEMGVWGEVPLVDLQDVSHLAISGNFVLGSGELSEERVEVYNFSWTPSVEGAYTQQSQLPNDMFQFNIVEPNTEDNSSTRASIHFPFDIEKFVEKNEHVSPEKLEGVKSLGDDPEAYINPELFEDGEKVIVTLTDEQYAILREAGVVSFVG